MSGATFETLLRLDAKLARKGHHPLTPWWKEQLGRWYAHPTARTLVGRVGRGGVKSNTSVKVSLNEVLFGDWKIPPGEVHFWAYASTSIGEARQRLRLIERQLTDLGVKYDRSGEELVLRDMPRGWRVFAATVGAVSGFRCFGRSGDELAKWTASDGAANPASEVVASMTAMAVNHAGARALLISSPVSFDDFHAQRFALGDTADQLVCAAPTWLANPSTTEEQCRRAEPDARIFAREYAAIPQDAKLAAFDAAAVARVFEDAADDGFDHGAFGVIDASSGKKDSWTFGVASWRGRERTSRRLVFRFVGGIGGNFWSQEAAGDQIVERVGLAMRQHGVRHVFADQRESLMLASAFTRHGLKLVEIPWTAPRKERAVTAVRRWLAEDRVKVVPTAPGAAKLRSELLAFEERVTSSGSLTFGARGSGHDDYVALLLTAAMAETEPKGQGVVTLPGSPTRGNPMVEALMRMGDVNRIAERLGVTPDLDDATKALIADARRRGVM